MQIVIDIDEEIFNKLPEAELGSNIVADVLEAVEYGIILPKGHGRLKDIDKIISDGRSKGFCEWYDEMKYTETIIEADK